MTPTTCSTEIIRALRASGPCSQGYLRLQCEQQVLSYTYDGFDQAIVNLAKDGIIELDIETYQRHHELYYEYTYSDYGEVLTALRAAELAIRTIYECGQPGTDATYIDDRIQEALDRLCSIIGRKEEQA